MGERCQKRQTRAKVNYDSLASTPRQLRYASTPRQLRYDNMCQAFLKVANLAIDDEEWSRAVMEWIKLQVELIRSRNRLVKALSFCKMLFVGSLLVTIRKILRA